MAEESKKSKKKKGDSPKKKEAPSQEEIEKQLLESYDKKVKELRELELYI